MRLNLPSSFLNVKPIDRMKIWAVLGAFIFFLSVTNSQSVITTYLCPNEFHELGGFCYHFSQSEATWQEAYFKCLNKNNSTFAELETRKSNWLIRQHLRKNRVLGKYERWIGGRFNEKKKEWFWGVSGNDLKFRGFSRMNSHQDVTKWSWHCIILDPLRQNKWGAKNCMEIKHFICQLPAAKIKFNTKKCKDPGLDSFERRKCRKFQDSQTAPGFLVKKTKARYKPKNFICPSHMILVGRKCYFFSSNATNWDIAYFKCHNQKTKLAMIRNQMEDNILRGFLNGNFIEKHERWIGGKFDWKQNEWKWAINGKPLTYMNFNQNILNNNHTFSSIILDPRYNHQWNSADSFQPKHYICQVKPKMIVKYNELYKFKSGATGIIKTEHNKDGILNHSNGIQDLTNQQPIGKVKFRTTEKYIYNDV